MATNQSPWVGSLDGATKPLILPGKVQAGSTAAIKRGEICVYNETAGYFVPANAVADNAYSLAIAAEEQKADDSARYMDFYMPRMGDVWELALSAAAAVELGDALTLVASESQQLTRDVDGAVAAVSVSTDNYPDVGVTLTNKSYVRAVVHPEYSYYYKNILQAGLKKVLTKISAYTLTLEDCGAIISTKGASGSVTITAPNAVVPVGWHVTLFVGAAQPLVFDPKPDGSKLIVKGAINDAGKHMSMTDEGDFAEVVWDGTDWLVVSSPSAADADITIES